MRLTGLRLLTLRVAGDWNILGDIMAESNIQPNTIIPDFGTLKNGKLDIIVNWDITSDTKTGDMGNEYIMLDYESVRINWVLPAIYESQAAIQSYLDSNYSTGENILGWAQASKLDYSGGE